VAGDKEPHNEICKITYSATGKEEEELVMSSQKVGKASLNQQR